MLSLYVDIERMTHSPILSGLKNETATVGDNVTFHCQVFSDPHPFIRWKRTTDLDLTNELDIKVIPCASLDDRSSSSS